MGKSKYVDIPSIVQVIGCVYNDPTLLDESDKYHFWDEDFTEEIHLIIFGSIYNLYMNGAKEITIDTIEDYLLSKPVKYGVYKTYNGATYIQKASENAQLAAFDYYYTRMKKMTLFREYEKAGIDLTWIYDCNILDAKKKQAQEEWIDNTSIEDIADMIDKKIFEVRRRYVDNTEDKMIKAGDGIVELVQQLQENPEIGYPLYGSIINTISRGARLKKLYLRSASTGIGKSRSMAADACFIACPTMYDSKQGCWIPTGPPQPTEYIMTEQNYDEIQTMCLAFVSDVNEDKIINGNYEGDELERVLKAAEIIKESPLYLKELPDFSMQDIENTIKYGIKEHDIRYVFFDYLHSSMKILGEINSKTSVKNLREDNILFMIATRLKDLCNKYGVFIMTATQLNAEYRTADRYDQNLLRGAKAIADKIDLGLIMLDVNDEDLEALAPVIRKGGFEIPRIKMSVYKNRRGKYKDILLWCAEDRGVCKITPMFATDYNYELIKIDDLDIKVEDVVKNEDKI